MTHTRRLVAPLLLAALLWPAGASDAPGAQNPTLRVLAPARDAVVPGPDVTVRLEIEGAVLGGRDRDGAFALLSLDGMPPVKSFSPRFTFRGVEDGAHRLTVEIRHADGGPFDPPLQQTIPFRVGGRAGPR